MRVGFCFKKIAKKIRKFPEKILIFFAIFYKNSQNKLEFFQYIFKTIFLENLYL